MTSDTPSQSGHWSRVRLAVNELDNTCWPWPPIWVTSISTLPTGIWELRPSCWPISPPLARASYAEGGHDPYRGTHRGIPSRASCPSSRRQPTHLRLICVQLPILVRVCLSKDRGGAFGVDVGTVGCPTGQQLSGASGNNAPELSRNAKRPVGRDPIILPIPTTSRARRTRPSSSRSGDPLQASRHAPGLLSEPRRSAGLAGCAGPGHPGRDPRPRDVAPRGLRGTAGLRIDRLMH